MSQDDLYVNYPSLKHSAPPLVPRVTPRTIFPKQKSQQTNEVNVKQARVQTQLPTRYKIKIQPSKTPNVQSLNASATSISDSADSETLSENLEAASYQPSGMSHACSNFSLPTYGTEGSKKKRKGLAKFIHFLRKLNKGKERLDKFLHHPIMQELGVTELIDDA
ncbi:hypothetical protein BgiBS90_013462 [Biomphalaria glabrata]|nr:hypothetical protein BgiBS90_013462 [Biomphalaria glabrata]